MDFKSSLLLSLGLTSLALFTTLLITQQQQPLQAKTQQASSLLTKFNTYLTNYNIKIENPDAYLQRLSIYKKNLDYIKEINSKNLSYTLGENQFTHLTQKEFRRGYLMKPIKITTESTDK